MKRGQAQDNRSKRGKSSKVFVSAAERHQPLTEQQELPVVMVATGQYGQRVRDGHQSAVAPDQPQQPHPAMDQSESVAALGQAGIVPARQMPAMVQTRQLPPMPPTEHQQQLAAQRQLAREQEQERHESMGEGAHREQLQGSEPASLAPTDQVSIEQLGEDIMRHQEQARAQQQQQLQAKALHQKQQTQTVFQQRQAQALQKYQQARVLHQQRMPASRPQYPQAYLQQVAAHPGFNGPPIPGGHPNWSRSATDQQQHLVPTFHQPQDPITEKFEGLGNEIAVAKSICESRFKETEKFVEARLKGCEKPAQRINEIGRHTHNLNRELDALTRTVNRVCEDISQFKADMFSRLDALEKKVFMERYQIHIKSEPVETQISLDSSPRTSDPLIFGGRNSALFLPQSCLPMQPMGFPQQQLGPVGHLGPLGFPLVQPIPVAPLIPQPQLPLNGMLLAGLANLPADVLQSLIDKMKADMDAQNQKS